MAGGEMNYTTKKLKEFDNLFIDPDDKLLHDKYAGDAIKDFIAQTIKEAQEKEKEKRKDYERIKFWAGYETGKKECIEKIERLKEHYPDSGALERAVNQLKEE